MNPQSLNQIFRGKANRRIPKNIAYEFQDFGVRLAQELNDLKRKSFYIRLSKNVPRPLLEKARGYALEYRKPKSKARVFMWFLKQMGLLGKNSNVEYRNPKQVQKSQF